MNDTHNDTLSLSRRCFFKLAAGTAATCAGFVMPALSLAAGKDSDETRRIKAVSFSAIPQDAITCANESPFIDKCWNEVLSLAGSISDTALRQSVMDLLKNPVPTFMQEYRSSASISQLYSALAAQHLIDTSKIDEAHLLPPYSGAVQAFRTAPGSGYGSHHPYPGGLASHVSTNMHITNYICQTYTEVFLYHVNRDIAMAGQSLHDIAKPFVFQWQKDGSSLKEYTIAGQGAHHTISLAEVIYRDFPPEEVIAQACAHGAPTSKQDEADVVGWLKAASLIAGKDPIAYGLLNRNGDGLPTPHHQEGYIVHLGDHDWVLSSPAAQKSVRLLKKIAVQKYDMTPADIEAAPFHHFRNYIGSQLSYMFLHHLEANRDGLEQAYGQIQSVIKK